MKILVLGSSSFAAQGLTELLRVHGHEVWSFNRRAEPVLGTRGLAGDLTVISNLYAQLEGCDVVVNYVLLKEASLEQNLQFLQRLDQLLQQINCKRFIHISSVSVLPPVNGTLTEQISPPTNFRQKGGYARLKISTEHWVAKHVTHCEVVLVRPGFVVAPGLLDPIVGIGKSLPTQKILGLGHPNSVIPVISREILNEGIAKLCSIRLEQPQTTVMFADPDSPHRKEYLEFCCTKFGMGRRPVFLPSLLWRLSLAAASVPMSILKRQWINLPARFSHNLKLRRYDARATEQLLDLDLHRDWKTLFAEALEYQRPNFILPTAFDAAITQTQHGAGTGIAYIGVGRIARERHLPALHAIDYRGMVEWYDPFADSSPSQGALQLARVSDVLELHGAQAVITTPVAPRLQLLRQLPATINEVLFEKPFAISPAQFCELQEALGQRTAYVIHNYRFKRNVQWGFGYLARHNPGRLQETRLHFDSPAVDLDKASWLREERRARTLLLDYAIHFLDLAWLLAEGAAEVKELDVQRNLKGQTMSISATVRFANHVSHLLLRQGARQRRCHIEFVFSNYSLLLRFFPDTVTVIHGQHTFGDDFRLGLHGLAATGSKVAEKLGIRASEPSHQYVLGSFLRYYNRRNIAALSLDALRPFYSRLFALAEPVYREINLNDRRTQVGTLSLVATNGTVDTISAKDSLPTCVA